MTITAYIDGSCDFNKLGARNKGGWGVFLFDDKRPRLPKRMKLLWGGERNTSVHRMSLQSAIQALKNTPKDRPLLVKTDNKNIQAGMMNWRNKNLEKSSGADLWQLLIELNAERDVTWQWLKSDSGDTGGRIAKKLSHLYTRNMPKYPEPNENPMLNHGIIAYELDPAFSNFNNDIILSDILSNFCEYTELRYDSNLSNP